MLFLSSPGLSAVFLVHSSCGEMAGLSTVIVADSLALSVKPTNRLGSCLKKRSAISAPKPFLGPF
jgi:hypothetical protein